ncbi:hypothetical protein ADUPG1_011302, partial [Aduncisulcus paluster]
ERGRKRKQEERDMEHRLGDGMQGRDIVSQWTGKMTESGQNDSKLEDHFMELLGLVHIPPVDSVAGKYKDFWSVAMQEVKKQSLEMAKARSVYLRALSVILLFICIRAKESDIGALGDMPKDWKEDSLVSSGLIKHSDPSTSPNNPAYSEQHTNYPHSMISNSLTSPSVFLTGLGIVESEKKPDPSKHMGMKKNAGVSKNSTSNGSSLMKCPKICDSEPDSDVSIPFFTKHFIKQVQKRFPHTLCLVEHLRRAFLFAFVENVQQGLAQAHEVGWDVINEQVKLIPAQSVRCVSSDELLFHVTLREVCEACHKGVRDVMNLYRKCGKYPPRQTQWDEWQGYLGELIKEVDRVGKE